MRLPVLGQVPNDLGLPSTDGQAVLVEAYPVKGQIQGANGRLDLRPDPIDGAGFAGQSRLSQLGYGRSGHGILELPHIRLCMDDGEVN